MASSPSRAARADGAGTGFARDFKDNMVPRFDNQTSSYREWRKRVMLYSRKLQLQGRTNEVAINILSALEGASWTQCEDLDLSELEKEGGLEILLRRLDSQWSYDSRIEMPSAFDAFFFKLRRKNQESLLEYTTEFHQTLREVVKHKIDLPEEVTGWLMMKRAGLTKEQEHLIQTQIGTTLTLGNVEKAMFLILGQDYRALHVPAHVRRAQQQPAGRWKRPQMVHQVLDEWGYVAEEMIPEEGLEFLEWEDDGEWEGDDWQDDGHEDTFYETDNPDTHEAETMFDTEEFDHVYATYVDAKQKLNQLRQARGFFPIVALGDGKGQMPVVAKGSASSSGGGGSPKGRKGKGGKSGAKSKGFSKGGGKNPTVKPRAKAVLNDMCLRCGRWDHSAANCPYGGKGSSSSSPPKKRVIDLDAADPMINMVLCLDGQVPSSEEDGFCEVEDAYLQGEQIVRAGGWITREPDACIQDQGASSFLIGSEYALRYLRWLQHNGYPMEELAFKKCDKGFKFGGDASGHARWMVELPVYISGIPGRLQAYVIFGSTPMLLGRPILEKLDVDISFGQSRMRILQGEWMDILRGKQDAMLLRLAGDARTVHDFDNPKFDLRCEDDHGEVCRLEEFLRDLNAYDRFEDMQAEVEYHRLPGPFGADGFEESALVASEAVREPAVLASACEKGASAEEESCDRDCCLKSQEQMQKRWRWMESQIAEAEKDAQCLVLAARDHRPPRRRLVWEVYVGEGRVTSFLQQSGEVDVMRFGLADGWDFNRAAHRKQLLRLCDDLEPDEIFMSPRCKLWSRMQNINVHCSEDQQDLDLRREVDHETHLRMCKKLYLKQVRRGDHAHIEHPESSLAWSTSAWKTLPGYKSIFHQCAYGSTTWDDNGVEKAMKKPTRIQTTKWAMFQRMSRRCDGSHAHQSLEGRGRCQHAENYQPELARNIALGILYQEGLEEQTFALEGQDPESEQLTGVLRRLSTRHGGEAVRLAYRLHRNLGHPRREVLVKMLESKKCSPQVLAAARELDCPYCEKHAVKKSSAPGHADRPTEFNVQVQADVVWLDLPLQDGAQSSRPKKVAVLVMVDSATRYMAARTVPDETGQTLQKAFEREWIKFHGPPTQLLCDEGTGWSSDSTAMWAESNDIDLRISPGQSHTRISVVERRHQLLRKAVSIFMLEQKLFGLDGIHTALNWVIPSLNSHTFVNGFTPVQLALGREPNIPGLLSDERCGPLQMQITEQERLHQKLQWRLSAQACAKAEIDVKLRRALLRQFKGRDDELLPGERCLYWREANNKFHTVQWRGPAVVVAVQRDPDTGSIDVYWLAHGTVLLRAGRQHVRKIPNSHGRVGGQNRAQEALENLRQRRVVRMIDLSKTNKRTLDELDPELDDDELYEPSILEGDPGNAEVADGGGVGSGLLSGPDETMEDALRELGLGEEPPTTTVVADEPQPLVEVEDVLPEDAGDGDVRQISVDEPMSEPSHVAPLENPVELPPVPEDNDLNETTSASAPMASTSAAVDPSYVPVPDESFESRRRRFDLQETIMTRLRPPERPMEPRQKKARTEEDLELELFGFDFSKMSLPEGWHYDSKTNEFFLGDTQDYWSFEDGFLVRNHVLGRKETFKAESFPVPVDELQNAHGLTMQRDCRTIYVNGGEVMHFEEEWLGKTLYPLTKEGAERHGSAYVGDLSEKMKRCKRFRGRGHIWAAAGVPRKKNVKEAVDLSERRMCLEDRLSFLEGKKAEIASIFENGVWEVETDPQRVDHGRVMKARFVLKWTVDSKGNPRAKARLVLQGFSDPDLLRGGLDTSSPTLNRTSRQVLLSISSCSGWARWVADVATAFLQGDPQQRVLWARIPRDAWPRQWYLVAKRRLESLGFQSHPLDTCLFRYYGSTGELICLVGIHVDDMLGTGLESSAEYQKLKQLLQKEFNFKHWTEEEDGKPLEFCGCKLENSEGALRLHQQDYIKNVKPVTCKDQNADRELTGAEVSSLRALLGALQWPATQSSPHLSASVSLLCGEVSGANVEVVNQANKTLRFAKQNSDSCLMFPKLGKLSDLCMVAMSDAAWGVRKNSQSQGGYLVLLAHRDVLSGKMDQNYIILDWRSFKLPRISRSSLNAESQASAAAMDALEYLLLFWHGCVHQDFELRKVNDTKVEMPSALVVDAKALYDSLKAEVPQLQGDKRTKIEVMVTKQKMLEMGTALRWVSSEVQLADGVTKSSARQLLADRLRTHQISLQADQTFQASKKKSMAERQASARRNAVSRLVNKKGLAFAVLTSQMCPVMASGADVITDYVLQPEMLLSALVLALSMFGFVVMKFLCFLWSKWTRAANAAAVEPAGVDVQVQTTLVSPEEREAFHRLRQENIRLRVELSDAGEAIEEWTTTLDGMQERVKFLQEELDKSERRKQDLQDMIELMSNEMQESQDALRRSRRKLSATEVQVREAEALVQRLRNYMENNPLPRQVILARRGRVFHPYEDCTALQNADRTALEAFEFCSFCATRKMLTERQLT